MGTRKNQKSTFVDEYGCVYSSDRQELIHVPSDLEYCDIKPGTKIISRDAFDNFYVDDDNSVSCDHLAVIFLPDSVEKIDKHAFFENRSLGIIYVHTGRAKYFRKLLPTDLAEKIVEVEEFEILIPHVSSEEKTFKDKDGVEYTLDKTKLVSFPENGPRLYNFPYKETKVICSSAFEGSNISNVVIPNTVKVIGRRAFANSKIQTIKLPESLVILPDSIFDGCDSLLSVQLPASISVLGKWCFSSTGIRKLELGHNLRRLLDYEFNDMLEEIIVDKKSKVFKSENGVLFSYNQKTLLRYPSNKSGEVYNIPDYVQTIGVDAFNCCLNLKYVSALNIKTVKSSAFWDCENLNYVNLGDKLQTIEGAAFGRCWNLVSIFLPSRLKEFSTNAFYSYYGGDISHCNIYTDNKANLLKVKELQGNSRSIEKFSAIIYSDEQEFYQGIVEDETFKNKMKPSKQIGQTKCFTISFNKPVNGLWFHDFEYTLSSKRVFYTDQISAVYDFKNKPENLSFVKIPECPKVLVITVKYTVYLTNWNTIEEAKNAFGKGGILNNCIKTENGNLYMLSTTDEIIKPEKIQIPIIAEIPRKDTLYQFYKNGKYGLKNYMGDIILPNKYYKIELFCGRYAIVSPSVCIIDLFTGERVGTFSEYKEITPYGNELIVRSKKNNLCHTVDIDGIGIRGLGVHYHIIPTGQGLIKVADKIDGELLWGILDKSGRELVPIEFKSITNVGEKSKYVWLNLYTDEKKYRLNISSLDWRYDWSNAIDMDDYCRRYNDDDDEDYCYRRSSYEESLLDACDGNWAAAMELEDRG